MDGNDIVENDAPDPQDILRILIATDNHLGYGEKVPIRADDSFVTFDEILEVALENDVDFVLLGGDLFHENKPSRQAYMKCMDILRKRCLGDRPISFQLVSDAKQNFGHCNGRKDVNYTDPNMNIGNYLSQIISLSYARYIFVPPNTVTKSHFHKLKDYRCSVFTGIMMILQA